MSFMETKNKRKICVVTSNRADYVKLRSVLRELKADPEVELLLVVAGSHLLRNYDTTIDLIRRDGFPVSYQAFIELEGRFPVTMAKSTALGINEFATAFHNLNPDIVLLHGDRFETLAAAVAASLMNIFIAHIEGGEVSGTIDEHIRHAVTKLSHFHFPTTEHARKNIIRLGEHPAHVVVAGCPGIDELLQAPEVALSELEKIINERFMNGGIKLSFSKGFILCVQHPVTTEYKKAASQIHETLSALKETKLPVVLLWPNIDAGADEISQAIRFFKNEPGTNAFHVFRNFPPEIFFSLLRSASVLVGNSSSGIREASSFGTPVVNVGTRQNGRTVGSNVITVGHLSVDILRAVKKQLSHGRYQPEHLYGKGGAGKKIAETLKTIDTSLIQKQLSYS